MNKNMKYRYLIVLVIGLALNSCQEFLEEIPTGSLTTQSTITSTESGLALVAGAYRYLPQYCSGVPGFSTGILLGALEYATGKALTPMPVTEAWQWDQDALTGTSSYMRTFWKNWFGGVKDCNLALELLPKVTDLSADQKSKYIGEVRVLRAWYYFLLVRYFGDLPLVTSVLTDVNLAQSPRVSLKTIYDKVIIPDLKHAIEESTLPDAQSTDGHVTKYVARMILADVYLTCAGYPYQEVATDTTKAWCTDGLFSASTYPVNSESAIDFLMKAKEQLDVLYGRYTLGTYDDLHDVKMNNKGEAIFQAQFLAGTINNFLPWNTLPEGSQLAIRSVGMETLVPRKSYYDSYDPADKRIQERQFFFTSDNIHSKWDPNESPDPLFNRDVAFLYKYYDYEGFKITGYSSLNYTFYRYAETLLMLTEVNWTLRQLGENVSDNDILKGINEVRRRALLSDYVVSDVDLLSIMGERAYELVFENKMIWDQRRTRMCLVEGNGRWSKIEPFVGHKPENFSFTLTIKQLLSPISVEEIDNNRQCNQNFGYTPKQIGQN